MKIIGLTGGIGSGKSYCASIFSQFDIPIYDSDSRAKAIMLEQPIKNQLIETFGQNTYFESGELNRQFLAQQVFQDQEKLQLLNQIVHPKVQEDRASWIKQQHSSLVVIEAAILIESKAYQAVDLIIGVYAPKRIRIQRVIERDQSTEQQVLDRMSKQLSDQEREQYCHMIIHNYGQHNAHAQIQSFLQSLSI